MGQLEMFGAHFGSIEKEKKKLHKENWKKDKLEYWERCHNWKAQVGGIAQIDFSIAYCKTIGRKQYSMGVRVKILSIDDNDVCTVETTKEWEEACIKADNAIEGELAGNIWLVDIENLAPVLN